MLVGLQQPAPGVGGGVLESSTEPSSIHDALVHLVADTRAYMLQLESCVAELQLVAGADPRAAAIAALAGSLLSEGRAIGLRRLNEIATEALRGTT